jgi:hypothetical protein
MAVQYFHIQAATVVTFFRQCQHNHLLNWHQLPSLKVLQRGSCVHCVSALAGAHKHVDAAVLRQARTFAKYATTVYGASFIEWLEKR